MKTMMTKELRMMICISIMVCISCSSTDNLDMRSERLVLRDIKELQGITSQQIKTYWQNDAANRFIKNDIAVHSVQYRSTDINGKNIELSGAVLIPDTDDVKGIISIQHSTFFKDEEAPSKNATFSVVSRKSIFASNGYIVILPDYQGYGIDEERIHPYHQSHTLAQASYDMIKASREALIEMDINPDIQLFLAGYSEGAYATAALQQLLEEKDELYVSASSLGSGSYDLRQTFESFLINTDKVENCTPCNAFFVQSYNDFYNMLKPMSYYFQEPYATEVENGLLLGAYDAENIASKLSADPNALFNPEFFQDYATDQTTWKDVLDQNTIIDWVIQSPTLITHNINDGVSPYFNSERLAGVNEGNQQVIFEPISGTNHFDGIFTWGIMTMDYFDQFE